MAQGSAKKQHLTVDRLSDVYLFGGTVYFTSSGTFDKGDYPGLRAVKVKCQGAGGGGGGAATTSSGQGAVGVSGYGGVYVESLILAAELSASETVTVGAGGSGGSAGENQGTSGGNSSFGAHAVAGGGEYGLGSGAATAGIFREATTTASTPAATGDLIIRGGISGLRIYSTERALVPPGGLGFLSGGGTVAQGVASGMNGPTETRYGAGGGAGANRQSQGTARAGGAGGPGIVIVELLY
jgi:hypothetical protein